MIYSVELKIFLKEGILDTQGKAVAASLKKMGYDSLKDLRVGKYLNLSVEAPSEEEARSSVAAMCDDLLVNDIIEEYSLDVEDLRS